MLVFLLQTTRIGLLVNGMRKKTQNNSLARRAKDLLRRWRDMVSKPGENGTGGTGQGPGLTGINFHSNQIHFYSFIYLLFLNNRNDDESHEVSGNENLRI